MDALGQIANNPSVAPKLLLTHRYDGGINWAGSLSRSSSIFYYKDIPDGSVDSLNYGPYKARTALASPSGVGFRQENIIFHPDDGIGATDVISDNSTDVPLVFSTAYPASTICNKKGNMLVIEQLKRTPPEWNSTNNSRSAPQFWSLIMYRYSYTVRMLPRCFKFSMKLPANLLDILADNPNYQAWKENWCAKGNNSNSDSQHRYAFKTVINAGETNARFELRFDLFNKDLSGATLPDTQPTGLWSLTSDEGAANPGDEYDVYIYIDQRVDRTDLDGETKVLVINRTQNTVAMKESITGVATCGYDQAPIGRISWGGCYTFGWPSSGTIVLQYADYQIWDKMPVNF